MIQNMRKYIKYVIPLVLGIKIGAWIGWADTEVKYAHESRIECMVEDKSIVGNTESGKRYVIDFGNNRIIPYDDKRLLDCEAKSDLEYIMQKQDMK